MCGCVGGNPARAAASAMRAVRSSSSGIGRACPSFFMALTRTLKSWSNQATQRFRVSLIEIDDRQTAFAQLAKPQRDSSERAHKRRIHHRTITQIDDELAGIAMDHLFGKVSQSRAVCGRTVSLHPNPNDAIRTTYQYFRSRFHRFVSRGPLLQPQSKQHFCFLAQVSDDLPNGG